LDQETGVCGLRRGISVPARRSKRPGSVREWDDPSGAPLSAAKSLGRSRRGRKRVNVVDIFSGPLSVLACQRRRGRHVEQCRRFQHDHRHEKKTPPRLPSRLRTRFLPRAGPLPRPSCPRPLDSCLARAAASPPPTRTRQRRGLACSSKQACLGAPRRRWRCPARRASCRGMWA